MTVIATPMKLATRVCFGPDRLPMSSSGTPGRGTKVGQAKQFPTGVSLGHSEFGMSPILKAMSLRPVPDSTGEKHSD